MIVFIIPAKHPCLFHLPPSKRQSAVHVYSAHLVCIELFEDFCLHRVPPSPQRCLWRLCKNFPGFPWWTEPSLLFMDKPFGNIRSNTQITEFAIGIFAYLKLSDIPYISKNVFFIGCTKRLIPLNLLQYNITPLTLVMHRLTLYQNNFILTYYSILTIYSKDIGDTYSLLDKHI